jgi:hypothetical protein
MLKSLFLWGSNPGSFMENKSARKQTLVYSFEDMGIDKGGDER